MTRTAIIYRAARALAPYADIQELLRWSLAAATADLVKAFRANNNTPGEG